MAATMMTMLMVSQTGPRKEPRYRILMAGIAMAHHIQLLVMRSSRSAQAAAVCDTRRGSSIVMLALQSLTMLLPTMAFAERLQVPGAKAPRSPAAKRRRALDVILAIRGRFNSRYRQA